MQVDPDCRKRDNRMGRRHRALLVLASLSDADSKHTQHSLALSLSLSSKCISLGSVPSGPYSIRN